MFGFGNKKANAAQLVEAAEMAIMMGNEQLAISKFREALKLDADNAEAWNNLGALLGGNNEHAEAKACFEHAVKLKPGYVNAWRGLAVSEKNLKRYDRALQICDKIEDELHGSSSDIREDTLRRMRQSIEPPTGNPYDGNTASASGVNFAEVLKYLMATAYRKGFLPAEDVKTVPELCCEAKQVVMKMLVAIEDDCVKREGSFNLVEMFKTCLEFAVYAGIGAALEWHRDWPGLKRKGIFNKLIEKKGIFAMDEYVSEMYTGKPFESDEGKSLQGKMIVITLAATRALMQPLENKDPKEVYNGIIANIPVVGVACYWFGVSFAMYKIVGR